MTEDATDAAPKPKVHYVEALKTELAEAKAEIERLRGVPAPTTVSVAGTDAGDEWRFVEKVIADLDIDMSGGSMTGVMKKIYNLLDAKVKTWRMAREITAEIGVGNVWPQWSALNRSPHTGAREVAEPAPAPVPEAKIPSVTDGGMPVRQSKPSKEDILAALNGPKAQSAAEKLKASVMAQVLSRPEPERKLTGAAV